METLITFFDELSILLDMVDRAFPAGSPGNAHRNAIFVSDKGNIAIQVWIDETNNFVAELNEEEDRTLSFEDVIHALQHYANEHTS